jgi:hypothetical protein
MIQSSGAEAFEPLCSYQGMEPLRGLERVHRRGAIHLGLVLSETTCWKT